MLETAQQTPGARMTSAPMPFHKYLQTNVVNEETADAINYFLETFEKHRKRKHPNLRSDQWEKHVQTFCLVNDKVQDNDCVKEIIEEYFKTLYPGRRVDYRIHHFNGDRNKTILMSRAKARTS